MLVKWRGLCNGLVSFGITRSTQLLTLHFDSRSKLVAAIFPQTFCPCPMYIDKYGMLSDEWLLHIVISMQMQVGVFKVYRYQAQGPV